MMQTKRELENVAKIHQNILKFLTSIIKEQKVAQINPKISEFFIFLFARTTFDLFQNQKKWNENFQNSL